MMVMVRMVMVLDGNGDGDGTKNTLSSRLPLSMPKSQYQQT
jgi:hypothetical protein